MISHTISFLFAYFAHIVHSELRSSISVSTTTFTHIFVSLCSYTFGSSSNSIFITPSYQCPLLPLIPFLYLFYSCNFQRMQYTSHLLAWYTLYVHTMCITAIMCVRASNAIVVVYCRCRRCCCYCCCCSCFCRHCRLFG